jgi:hypothetical protein
MLNRVAKDVLRYKNPMSVEDAEVFLDFERKYVNHIDFLRTCSNPVSEKYFIKTDSKLKIDLDKQIVEVPSLDEIEEILNTNEDPTDLVLMGITQILKYLEDKQSDDDAYYRIISLTSFYKSEFFDKNWLKSHLDFMFSYYYQDNLGFSNLSNPCFSGVLLDEDVIYEGINRLDLGKNMNVYNLLRRYDDYIVYVCDNIRTKPAIPYPTNISRMMLSDCFTISIDSTTEERLKKQEIINNIAFQIIYFYRYSIMLQNNYPNKELSLLNLQKLSNLQKESYSSYIDDVDLLTIRVQ